MAVLATERFVYDDRISNDDRRILESRSDVFSEAVLDQDRLYWTVIQDDRQRKYFQLRKYANPQVGYVELALDEVGQLDDVEIKRIVIFNERPCIDVAPRIERWIDRLNGLYHQIEHWIEGRGFACLRSTVRQQREGIMVSRGIAPRHVPVLHAERDGQRTTFTPGPLWIVGANGRVDVHGSTGSHILADLAPDDAQQRDWRMVVADFPRTTVPFDQQVCLEIISDS